MRLVWYLRQLLPLWYESNWSDADGNRWHTTWRMWLGRCYDVWHMASI